MELISDHQQSVAPVPSWGLPHTPTALLVVADLEIGDLMKRRATLLDCRGGPPARNLNPNVAKAGGLQSQGV